MLCVWGRAGGGGWGGREHTCNAPAVSVAVGVAVVGPCTVVLVTVGTGSLPFFETAQPASVKTLLPDDSAL